MKIHKIKVTNFRSMYGTHEFDFDQLDGLVKLSGPIGSGKTTLGEAILCGLLGKVKSHTSPSMVAWGTDTYEIELDLTSQGHDIHIIRNPKKQLDITIDGNPVASTGKLDMQQILEGYYDVPKMAIERMCIISFNSFSSLASMSPYETKQFLDDVFGFKTFTVYNDQTVIERKDQLTHQTELTAIEQETERQIQNLIDKKNRQKEEVSQSFDIDKLNADREQIINEGKELKEQYNKIQEQKSNELNIFDEKIRTLENKKTEAATLGKIQKNNYQKFKDGKCPTCGHEIDATVIGSYKQKMDAYAADWKQFDFDQKKLQNERLEKSKEYDIQLSELNQKMNNLRGNISKIDNDIRQYNTTLKVISENYDELINTYEQQLKETQKKLTECAIEINEWDEMSTLFTKTFRYSILDTLIPHINSSIQYYMRKLDQGYKVQYDQEFKAHIYSENIDGEINYNDLSTGQKKTLDLAIIFGILQNIIANVNFNIIFLDELMSNMDPEFRNQMLTVLKETLSDERSIFVINHAEMGDDYFSHKIRVSLQNKIVKMTKKKLKKAVDTGSDEIVARSSNYTICF